MKLKCLIGLHDWQYTILTNDLLTDPEVRLLLRKKCMRCNKIELGKRSIIFKTLKKEKEATYKGNEFNVVIRYDVNKGVKTCSKCSNVYFDSIHTMKVCRTCGQRYEKS